MNTLLVGNSGQMMVNTLARVCQRWVGCVALISAVMMSAVVAQAATPTLSSVASFDLLSPSSGLVQGTGQYASYLYGVVSSADQTRGGLIYRVPKEGGKPETIYQLKTTDGYAPTAALIVGPGDYLYGTTHNSSRTVSKLTSGSGTIFRIAQDGTGYETLYDFGGRNTLPGDDSVFADYQLLSVGDYLYGVASSGGSHLTGEIFRFRLSDRVYQALYSFSALNTTGTSSAGDGAYPSSPLLLAGGRLYGVTSRGGPNLVTQSTGDYGTGTLYSMATDGSDFQVVHAFASMDATQTVVVNSEGVSPSGTLVEASTGVIFGTSSTGGTPAISSVSGAGTVFKVDLGTRNFTTIYNFDVVTGSAPSGLLKTTAGQLIGGTASGSSDASVNPTTAYGVIYSIDPNVNTSAAFTLLKAMTLDIGSNATALFLANDGDLYGTTRTGNSCSGYGGVFRYSLTTGATSTGYANCTPVATSSSGGGAMQPQWLWVLALPVWVSLRRRRV